MQTRSAFQKVYSKVKTTLMVLTVLQRNLRIKPRSWLAPEIERQISSLVAQVATIELSTRAFPLAFFPTKFTILKSFGRSILHAYNLLIPALRCRIWSSRGFVSTQPGPTTAQSAAETNQNSTQYDRIYFKRSLTHSRKE